MNDASRQEEQDSKSEQTSLQKIAAFPQELGTQGLPFLLNTKQAASFLAVSRSTLYTLIMHEHLPVVYIGRTLRFRLSSLLTWVEEREQYY